MIVFNMAMTVIQIVGSRVVMISVLVIAATRNLS